MGDRRRLRADDESPEAAAFAAGRRLGLRTALMVLLAVGWFGTLVLGLGYAALLDNTGDLNCEPTPGSSDYGEFGWSAVPPGPTCTFTAARHGFDEVRGPSPVMSIWVGALLAGFVVLLVGAGRTARSWNSSWRELDRAGPETELTPR